MPSSSSSPTDKKKKRSSKKSSASSSRPIPLAGDEYNTQVPPSLDQRVRVVSELNALDNTYERGPQLGLGAFAKVFLGIHKASGTEYAIKKIDRSKMLWGDRDALEDEINNLITVREGPNIVQLYEVYEEKSHCFLVLELMRGGELFDRILEKKIFTESEARAVAHSVLTGLRYMHQQRVAHRDLKPENLLMCTTHSDTQVKLADFGFAKRVKGENGCRTLCGTPGYLAPEILERWPAYDVKCDLWSVGVILFLLLGGYLPFEDDDEDRVFERTRNGQYYFHPAYWKSVSKQAKNFCTKLLTVNPKKRNSASDALEDEWMTVLKSQPPQVAAAAAAPHAAQQPPAQPPAYMDELREKVQTLKTKNNKHDPNRLKVLNQQFGDYLDRKGEDEHKRVLAADKKGNAQAAQQKRFVEDSQTGKPFEGFYDLGEVLGEGGYAIVYRAEHRRTKETYAVKDINTAVLEGTSKNALKDEIAALKLLRGGPYIIRLYDVFEEANNTYMVMECCNGGDLLTRVTEKEFYTEREARLTCKILFQAMDYIHKKKICHRDIKPENVLMVEAEDDTSIKIADFGFAKRVTKTNCLRTLCGTAQYVAPEVLDLHSPGYDHRADMWSVGVVTYILLGGYAPFDGPVHELARVICNGDYCFHDKYWSDISDAAKDMISKLLTVDPNQRYSAEDALQCKWMIMEDESLTVKDLSGVQAVLKQREPGQNDEKINPINKYESLDYSFTMALGTLEEVALRKAQRTTQGELATLDEDENLVEDSSSGKTFEELYTWGRLIEEGNFHVTREARHNQSMEIYCIKSIRRTDLETSDAVAVQDEISTLTLVKDCPYIIKLHDVFEEPDFTYMCLERLRGGEIIDRLVQEECYTERNGRLVAKKILAAVEYCHNHRVAHRNLKTENIVMTDRETLVDVKISDFGFAKRVLYPNALQTQCGTEGYVAPEVLEHRPAYDVQCDMWSMGVLLYLLLGGYRPFRGEGEEVIRQIRYGEYKFHKRYWSKVSEEAKILISRMLCVNPLGRITATAALQSDWINMEDGELDANLKFQNEWSQKAMP